MFGVCVFLTMLAILPGCLSQHGLDEYNYEEYPKSLADKENCGRDGNSRPIYVCDPNKILKEADASQLDVLIEVVMNETQCKCSALICSQSAPPGYRISIALVKKLRLPEKKMTGKDKMTSDLQLAMGQASIFTTKKLSDWNLGRCTEDVLLLYSVMDGVLYTVTGDEAGQVLKPPLVAEILLLRRPELHRDVFNGLRLIVSDYKAVFMKRYKPMPHQKPSPKYEAVRGGATTPMSILFATALTFIITAISHI